MKTRNELLQPDLDFSAAQSHLSLTDSCDIGPVLNEMDYVSLDAIHILKSNNISRFLSEFLCQR